MMMRMPAKTTRSAAAAAALATTAVAFLALAVLTTGCSQRPQAGSVAALKVGNAITVEKPIAIAALAQDPAPFVGQTVRLEGTVASVCQGKGCWVEVQGADGGKFLARSMDDSVLVPTDCAGRRIVVQGTVVALPPREETPEAAEAHAEGAHAEGAPAEGAPAEGGQAGEAHAEAGHVCPSPTYLVSTQGIELYDTPRPPARPSTM
jgi:hypothetical protein